MKLRSCGIVERARRTNFRAVKRGMGSELWDEVGEEELTGLEGRKSSYTGVQRLELGNSQLTVV